MKTGLDLLRASKMQILLMVATESDAHVFAKLATTLPKRGKMNEYANKKIGLVLGDLASRKIRETSTGGALIRTWSTSPTVSSSNKGFLENLWDGASRFVGFLISEPFSL
jgi:hypothetical protein